MPNLFTYKALKARQQPDGPTLYLTSIPAKELLKWADVPRKRVDFQAGYQRQLDEKRMSNIKDFVELDSNNLIPGALLVSVDVDAFNVDEDGGDDNFVKISIETDLNRELSELIADTYEKFYNRLNERERQYADGELDIDLENLEEGAPLPSSYLAELTRELGKAKEDFQSLDDDRQTAVQEYVEGMSRPGRILDGQHRVFGAKDVADFDVQFPVVLMPGLSESEQVFHFFVVNNKAKPLKPAELRSTISTSLSDREINELYDRLRNAGVKAEEAKLSYRLNENPNSPFRGLIDFGLDDDTSFIPENVAYQLVRKFVKMPTRFAPLYKDVEEWEQDPEFDYRLSMFFAFWQAIKDTYSAAWSAGVQEKEGQLFYKVSLLMLQEKVLESLKPMNELEKANTGTAVLGNRDSLIKLVKIILAQLDESFWVRKWQEKVADSGQFKDFLKDQMRKAMDGADIGRLKLFKQVG